MQRFMKPKMRRFGGGIIFSAGLLPMIPVDIAGVLAGSSGYPVRRFLLYLAAGKMISTVALVYAIMEAVEWLSPYVGWLK